jgi:hypothetical protein
MEHDLNAAVFLFLEGAIEVGAFPEIGATMGDQEGRIDLLLLNERSCPVAWCSWRWVTAFAGESRIGQLAIAGRLTAGSSLNGAMVSSVM